MSLRPAAPDAPGAPLPPPPAWRGGAETGAPASRLHLVLAAGQRSAETSLFGISLGKKEKKILIMPESDPTVDQDTFAVGNGAVLSVQPSEGAKYEAVFRVPSDGGPRTNRAFILKTIQEDVNKEKEANAYVFKGEMCASRTVDTCSNRQEFMCTVFVYWASKTDTNKYVVNLDKLKTVHDTTFIEIVKPTLKRIAKKLANKN